MAKMRSHSQTLDAVKAFVDRWTGRGYEKGESQQFWTDLLHDVNAKRNHFFRESGEARQHEFYGWLYCAD